MVIEGGVLAATRVGELQLVAQGQRAITDGEWRQNLDFIAECHRLYGPAKAAVVWSPKHSPTAKQRKMLVEDYSEFLAQQKKLAVVTESIIARGAATAVGWLTTIKTRGFAPRECEEVFRWLADVCRFDLEEARKGLQAALQAVHLSLPLNLMASKQG
jgi:hypothetical protein